MQSSLSMVERALEPGTADEVKKVISLMLVMKPKVDVPEVALNLWVAKCKDYPMVAIMNAADAVIMDSDPWIDLGRFKEKVESKAGFIHSMRRSLKAEPLEVREVERSTPPKLEDARPLTERAGAFHEPKLKPRNEARLAKLKAAILGKQ